MKNSHKFLFSLLAFLVSGIGQMIAAPLEPEGRLIEWRQPAASSSIMLRVFGDEYYSRTETLAGYTVILSGDDYVYAKLSADGKKLQNTFVLAHKSPPAGLAKHLEISRDEIFAITSALRTTFDSVRKQRWAQQSALKQPAVGTRVGLTVLVQFSDKSFPAGLDQNKVTRLCNFGFAGETLNGHMIPASPTPDNSTDTFRLGNSDRNVGSVYQYFSDQSEGKLKFVQIVTPVVTLAGTRESYNLLNLTARQVGEKILRDAITLLRQTNFDFKAFSDPKGSDFNGIDDGFLRSVNVIVAGDDSGVAMRGIWPHSSQVSGNIEVIPPDPNTNNQFNERRLIREYNFITTPTSQAAGTPLVSATVNDGSFESFAANIVDTSSPNFLTTVPAASKWIVTRALGAAAAAIGQDGGLLEADGIASGPNPNFFTSYPAGGTATTNGVIVAGLGPSNAFDGDRATRCLVNLVSGAAWIQYQFGDGKRL